MPRYAKDTHVSADRSRVEIERTLQRYGAHRFAYASEEHRAMILFEAHGRRIRFLLPLPDRNDDAFWMTPSGRTRTETQAVAAYEQAVRQCWRALALAIKAKLESVESGIETFEEAFLAHIVLPSGETVGEWMGPQVDQAYLTGRMPPLLPGPGND